MNSIYFHRLRFKNHLRNFQPENSRKFKNKPGWPETLCSLKRKSMYLVVNADVRVSFFILHYRLSAQRSCFPDIESHWRRFSRDVTTSHWQGRASLKDSNVKKSRSKPSHNGGVFFHALRRADNAVTIARELNQLRNGKNEEKMRGTWQQRWQRSVRRCFINLNSHFHVSTA